MISAWEAGILANRGDEKVSPDFAKFYKEQVLAGNIQKDTYGKNTVGVFYNSSKPYLDPMTSMADDKKLNLYSDAGKTEAINILNTTSAQVAQIYLDSDGNGKGDHFVIAYKDPSGKWIIKDHNYEEGSKVGDDLVEALAKDKIKDIRLVYPGK